MDIGQINIIINLLSGAMMLGSIVYMITFMLGSFSSRSGAQSIKTVLLSLLYFFGSTIPMFYGVEWLMEVARDRAAQGSQAFYLNIGASGLALSAFLNICCGLLTIGLYVKGLRSQGLTVQQAVNEVRNFFRPKSRK
jgi:hypothetical protein